DEGLLDDIVGGEAPAASVQFEGWTMLIEPIGQQLGGKLRHAPSLILLVACWVHAFRAMFVEMSPHEGRLSQKNCAMGEIEEIVSGAGEDKLDLADGREGANPQTGQGRGAL